MMKTIAPSLVRFSVTAPVSDEVQGKLVCMDWLHWFLTGTLQLFLTTFTQATRRHGRASEFGSAGSPTGPARISSRQRPWRQSDETSTNAMNAWMTSGPCWHHAARTYIQPDLQLSGLTQTSSRLKVHICRTPEPSITSSCTWAGRRAHNKILIRNLKSRSRSLRHGVEQQVRAEQSESRTDVIWPEG